MIVKEPNAQNLLEYPAINGEISIPTRDCQENTDINKCCCHLRQQATFFIKVFEIRLCSRECKIHSRPPPQNLYLQPRSINDNFTEAQPYATARRGIILREQERPAARVEPFNFTYNTAPARQQPEQYPYNCNSCGYGMLAFVWKL
jgi:hypothetical protein